MFRATAVGAVAAGALLVALAGSAGAAVTLPPAHGDLLHVVKPSARANASQSNNWFGYNQGTLEQGSKQFHSIRRLDGADRHPAHAGASGELLRLDRDRRRVRQRRLLADRQHADPDRHRAGRRRHRKGELLGLVRARAGAVAGRVHDRRPRRPYARRFTETVSGADVWKITLQDVTRNETFTTTVPYPSTHLTAEWIEETPLLIGTDAGLASLPNLSNPAFNLSKTNGAGAGLKASEAVQLTDANGTVIGTPSAPDAQADGFAACSWATSC
jgi:hypothetical protein